MSADVIDPCDAAFALNCEAVKSVQALLQVLKERVSFERFYAKGMEKTALAELAETGTLGEAATELRNHIAIKGEQASILAEDLSSDLVEPLQSYLAKQVSVSKKITQEGKTLSAEAKQAKHGHDLAYQKYRRACSELDQVLSRLEVRSSHPDSRYEDLSRLQVLRKDCWDSARHYKSSLDQYQAVKQRFDGRMSLERTRRETIRDLLRKLVIYESSWLRNLQYETEKMAEVMERIDSDRDLAALFPKFQVSLPVLQYRPWKGDDFRPVEDSGGMLQRLRKVTGKLFNSEEKVEAVVQRLAEKAWRGELLKLDEEFALHSALKDRKGREIWVADCLNRSKSAVKITVESALQRLREQLTVVFHECEQSKESDLPLLLLSQCPVDSEVQSLIRQSPLFQRAWVWQHSRLPHTALQPLMESLGLPPSFIYNAIGTYQRRPSLSVSEYRKTEIAQRQAPVWVKDLDSRPSAKVNLSISQALPALHTEDDEELEPEMTTEQIVRGEIDKEEDSKRLQARVEDETYDPSKHVSPSFSSPCTPSHHYSSGVPAFSLLSGQLPHLILTENAEIATHETDLEHTEEKVETEKSVLSEKFWKHRR